MPASKPADAPRLWWFLLAGLVHGGFMFLAFPPVTLWAAVFLAPIPLISAALMMRRVTRAPARGLRARAVRLLTSPTVALAVGVLPFHLFAHQWVFHVSEIGYPPMAFILAMLAAAFSCFLARLLRCWPRLPIVVGAPVVWIALEFFRGEILVTGYPWILIAHPLIDAPLIPHAAAVLGTYFVGFVVVMLGGAVMDVRTSRMRGIVGIASALAIGIGIAAVGRSGRAAPGPAISVGIVQTNIPQSNKLDWEYEARIRDFNRFCELTRKAAAGAPGLVVWPETMFPGLTLSAQGVEEEKAAGLSFRVRGADGTEKRVESTLFYDGLIALSTELKVPMLVGAIGVEGLAIGSSPSGGVTVDFKRRFNSVYEVRAGRIADTRYDKLDLTPFGEIFPYVNHWPWLQNQLLSLGASGMAFDLSSGAGPRVFQVETSGGPIAVVTPICFEATKPALCRKLVRAAGKRPVLIANLTNDGWFGTFGTGKLQHLQVARWRCVELGVPMIRAANTGVSAGIDHTGRVLKTGIDGSPGASNVDGVLSVELHAMPAATLYASVGDAFGWCILVVGSALMLIAALKKPRTVEDSR